MALSGTEVLQVQGVAENGMLSGQTFQTTTGAIAALASGGNTGTVITPLNTVGAGTITAAGIVGKITQRGGSQSDTAFTDTTATAAAIIALLPSASQVVGESFSYTYQNLTNAVATITGGIGVTVSGEATIPANGYVKYLLTIGASSTLTMVGYENGGFAADATDSTKVVGFTPSGQTTGTTALFATVNTANATYTLPAATDTLAGIGTVQTWGAAQTFPSSDIKVGGSSTGVTSIASANASATNYTATLPAASGTVAYASPAPTAVGSSLAITAAMSGAPILLNTAGGSTATLPAATGSGNKYTFIVTATTTSAAHKILAASSSDYLNGIAVGENSNTAKIFASAASTNHSIQMPYTGNQPSGGIIGDQFVFTDVAANLWQVNGTYQAGTTPTTPFSTATS